MQALVAIEPRTVFVVATLMILLNGGVLGLMHRSLASDVQPSALSWRIGTLLQAAGCILLAMQQMLPAAFVLPLANGCILLGVSGYHRALRQFHGLPEHWLPILPCAFGTLGTYWFAAFQPSLDARIIVVSLAMASIMFACAWTLIRHSRTEPMTSRSVLTVIFAVCGVLMLARAAYSTLVGTDDPNLLQATRWQLVLAPLMAATLPVVGTTAFLLMCSERLRLRWEHAASTDYLTGLANRRTVALAGERAFQSARNLGTPLSVAVLDVDHFKRINDSHGHDQGDLALQHLATVLKENRRNGDLPGRLGGEEFVLLCDRANEDDTLATAGQILQQLRSRLLVLDNTKIALTVSIGVATLHASDRHFDDMLRRADQALYAAKTGGRDRVELSVP